MKKTKIKLGLWLSICLFLICGCDGYLVRQSIIDFNKNRPQSFAVVEPKDVNKMFSLIEQIAQKNGLNCKPYDEAKRSVRCSEGPVSLMTSVINDKTIKIELTQFGPWGETKMFSAVEEAVSKMLKEEFPEQNIQMINPMRKQ